jgi:hypothetical protein
VSTQQSTSASLKRQSFFDFQELVPMNKFIRKAALAVGFAALFGIGASAQATVVITNGSFGVQTGVHANLNPASPDGHEIYGYVNQEGSGVTFKSTQDTLAFATESQNGEATVVGVHHDLEVDFEHAWTHITFDIAEVNKTNFTFTLQAFVQDNGAGHWETVDCSVVCSVDKNTEKFEITSTAGITALKFDFNPYAGDLKQFRVEGLELVPATPEPSTWAMIILGFAGMAYLASRRRKGVTQQPAMGMSFA